MDNLFVKKRILVVDDNLSFADTLSFFLEGQGYAVSSAGSVDAAIGLLAQEVFDVILTDIRIGQQSGVAILEYMSLFSKESDAILIGMTAYYDEEEVHRSKARFHVVLEKPFPLDSLIVEIERHARSRQE